MTHTLVFLILLILESQVREVTSLNTQETPNTYYAIYSNNLIQVTSSVNDFSYKYVGDAQDWSNSHTTVQCSAKHILILKKEGIFRMRLNDGYSTRISLEDLYHAKVGCFYGGLAYVFGVQGIFSINPESGETTHVLKDGSFEEAYGITQVLSSVFITTHKGLYEVNLSEINKPIVVFKENFRNGKAVATHKGYIYVLRYKSIERIDPRTYTSIKIGQVNYTNFNSLCGFHLINFGRNGFLFGKGMVVHIDLETGQIRVINKDLNQTVLGLAYSINSSYFQANTSPLLGGYWKLIFKVTNPVTSIKETLTINEGLDSIDGTIVDNKLIGQFQTSIVQANQVGTFLGSSYYQFGKEFNKNLKNLIQNGITPLNQRLRNIVIYPGKTIQCWQYVIQGANQYNNLEIYTNVFQDTHGEDPINE